MLQKSQQPILNTASTAAVFKYFIIQSNCLSSNAFKCCYGIPSRLFKMVTLFLAWLFMKFIQDDIFNNRAFNLQSSVFFLQSQI